MKTQQKLAALASATMLFGTSATAFADHDDRYGGHGSNGGAQYDYARVISAQPLVRYVKVKKPVRECWQETQRYSARRDHGGNAGGTLLGAIIGSVIGHQVGSGRGNDAATIAGGLIGAAIGNGAGHDDDHHDGRDGRHQSRQVERCDTRYQESREKRIDGYRVTYRFNGQKYVTEMPYDPGESLRVRVDVRPAR